MANSQLHVKSNKGGMTKDVRYRQLDAIFRYTLTYKRITVDGYKCVKLINKRSRTEMILAITGRVKDNAMVERVAL